MDIIAGPDALRSVPGLIDLFCKVAPLLEMASLLCSNFVPFYSTGTS